MTLKKKKIEKNRGRKRALFCSAGAGFQARLPRRSWRDRVSAGTSRQAASGTREPVSLRRDETKSAAPPTAPHPGGPEPPPPLSARPASWVPEPRCLRRGAGRAGVAIAGGEGVSRLCRSSEPRRAGTGTGGGKADSAASGEPGEEGGSRLPSPRRTGALAAGQLLGMNSHGGNLREQRRAAAASPSPGKVTHSGALPHSLRDSLAGNGHGAAPGAPSPHRRRSPAAAGTPRCSGRQSQAPHGPAAPLTLPCRSALRGRRGARPARAAPQGPLGNVVASRP